MSKAGEGSALQRTIEHLRERGGTVTHDMVAQRFGVTHSGARVQLAHGARCGALVNLGGRPVQYKLGTGVVKPYRPGATKRERVAAEPREAVRRDQPATPAPIDIEAEWKRRLRPGSALQAAFGMRVPRGAWTGPSRVVLKDDAPDESDADDGEEAIA